ncbi:anhydro-N-acetylmuramic acid kinase [Edaphobacter dinghuensis]|uniref:Anhydro-N-acetylmuramic acid kinase n=1 Tax=Edaphobacter dinghuensis TaxID=1560005 RepID=A0A917HNV0_9BACT|nr:anhydro-N-acetylmuramic acid kinase [Edaphobacter dinghuensis]GGG85704.1 anhydro-N-acetylmuramic acid kinase [Edaphobacter dinghuensis]
MPKSMVVAGVMSGTSADGVDVALCRISAARDYGDSPRIKLLGHAGFRYSKAVRAAVLAAMDAKNASVADLSRLNWRLGEIYADCVEKASTRLGIKIDLIGCHGQTIYHQAVAEKYLGSPVRCTWQMGEASVIAERLRVPVVSDFRPADMAAAGQGAPLVPMLDYVMFRSAKVNRVLQNLGGIGNLTAIPAGCAIDGVMAFDTGPGNMVIDACMQRLRGKAFDRGGAVARQGRIISSVLTSVLAEEYFSASPPKSCGREQFGADFVSHVISVCRKARANDADIVATATALTAESVSQAYQRFVWAHLGTAAPLAKTEFVVAGGGAKNAALMTMLGERLQPLGVKIRLMRELGVPGQAKEAVAFAMLAWLTWNGVAGNVVAATGAKRPVVLGKVTHG